MTGRDPDRAWRAEPRPTPWWLRGTCADGVALVAVLGGLGVLTLPPGAPVPGSVQFLCAPISTGVDWVVSGLTALGLDLSGALDGFERANLYWHGMLH